MHNPITLRGIDHVVLRCTDVPAMLHFYQQVLGASLERSLEELGLYQLRAGGSLIDIVDCAKALGHRAGGVPDSEAANMDHFCLLIQDWDAQLLGAWLQQQGVAYSEIAERYGAEGFGPSLYVQDPAGNTIELKKAMQSEQLDPLSPAPSPPADP